MPVLIALFHDILITGGVYALTGKEVSSGTVAVFLTILGYSLYDTIIVFDRIRENVHRVLRKSSFQRIVNRVTQRGADPVAGDQLLHPARRCSRC